MNENVAPAPAVSHAAPAPAVSHATPAPVIEYPAGPAVTDTALTPARENVSPALAVTPGIRAPVIEPTAPVPAVTDTAPTPAHGNVAPHEEAESLDIDAVMAERSHVLRGVVSGELHPEAMHVSNRSMQRALRLAPQLRFGVNRVKTLGAVPKTVPCLAQVEEGPAPLGSGGSSVPPDATLRASLPTMLSPTTSDGQKKSTCPRVAHHMWSKAIGLPVS